MVTATAFAALCMALDATTAVPHMGRTAFRTPRRIYATLAADERTANLGLPGPLQDLLCNAQPDAFAPVSGGFGRMGWTTVTLAAVDEATLVEVLQGAHALAAPVRKKRAARRP